MAEELIGRTLGRYKITALVGRGGMATVYKATHPGLEQTVAVKVLHAHMATDADLLGRFQQEARAVAALRHPNIVRVVDFDCIDNVYFMVMEYVDGDTMSSHLRTMSAKGRRMSAAEVLQIFEPLCSAVDYAHGLGMVHRDIKPSNVLLTTQGEPVLTDYGIAKMIGVTQHTATGTVMGSAYYMSPEQAQGIAVDGRSDIYSMGVMLFEVLGGRVPYEGDTLATVLVKHITAPVPAVCALNQDLPPVLDGLMRVALAKDPGERFQTGKALAVALRQGLGPATAGGGAAPVAGTVVERPGAGGAATQGSTGARARTSAPARTANTRTAGHDVFLSYAVADKAVADAVCDALEADGIRCWMAPRDVLPGQSYAKALSSAIHTARVFILVFSSATNQSQQVERELDMAVASRLPLVPLRVEDVMPRESIEYYLAGQHWLDAITPPLDRHLARLSEAVGALLEQSAPAADAAGAAAAVAGAAAPVAPPPATEPAPAPQEETTYEAPAPEPVAKEPVAPEPTEREPGVETATPPPVAAAAGLKVQPETAEVPLPAVEPDAPAAVASYDTAAGIVVGVAAAAGARVAAEAAASEPEVVRPAEEAPIVPEAAEAAEEPAVQLETLPATPETGPEPASHAEGDAAPDSEVAEAEPEVAEAEPEVAEAEPEVAEAEPEVAPEPVPVPDALVAPEPEPEAAAPSDATTFERPGAAADLAAATAYEALAEATPAAAATTYETPAEAGGMVAATAYETPAAVAPAAETTYETPADPTPAGAMTYGSASDAAAFAAAAAYEPPAAGPPASDVAAGTAAAPAAAAVGSAALGDRSAAAGAASREGLHKPTLFVAAGIGVAWIVILFVLDKFVL